MSDDAFIRAILADPGEDALRLVYADWLDERGDALVEVAARDHDLSHRRPNVPPVSCGVDATGR